MTKQEALAKFLDTKEEVIESSYDDSLFEVDGEEFLVLTDDEADEKAIAGHTDMSDDVIQAVKEAQIKLCEGANLLVKAIIKDIDHFVDDAIKCDGRGHFLSPYDGNEEESREYFIYRIN